MKAFLRNLLGAFLGGVLILVIIAGIAWLKLNETTSIEDHSYLVIDFYGGITEYDVPSDPVGQLMAGGGETLQRVLTNLEMASADDRIEGVVIKFSSNWNAGPAMMEEIRGGIATVQAAGKKVYGWADSLDRGTLYAAVACDSLYAPRPAYINFTGFGGQRMYIKRALEKLGIEAHLHRIKDYKAAAEMITRTDMSGPVRENVEWILSDLWDMYMEAMQAGRGLSEEQVVACMEHAWFNSWEAVEMGLVDRLVWWDELDTMLRHDADEPMRTVDQRRYAEEDPADFGFEGDETIAVVHAHGNIGGRSSRVDPLLGIMMGHETVVADLRRARLDDDVAAIVFRVDSGGGESLASDIIGREIEICAAEKPVVVSMVDVAASGGYSVSYRATKLMADRATITGSIGSISGKFDFSGLYEKLGIDHDGIARGPNALADSEVTGYTPEQRERFVENHWDSVNDWFADIAEHRGMTFEEIEALAHGRVFTGSQAAANGLIDAVGGLDEAVALAKELSDIDADEQVTLEHWPQPQDLLGSLMGGGGEGDASAALQYVLYRWVRTDLADSWRMLTEGRMMMMEGSVSVAR